MKAILYTLTTVVLFFSYRGTAQTQPVLLKNVTVIDGTGKPPQKKMFVLIDHGKIADISSKEMITIMTVMPQDFSGKIIMPVITNAHAHLGTVKGVTASAVNYTRDNILRQLQKYETYGVDAIQVMGSDREMIFDMRDSSQKGLLPGATIYTAGYGFSAPNGGPPSNLGMDKVYRPATPEEAIKDVQELATLKPDLIKMWVDDFGGTSPKMKPEISAAIISEAHRQHIRVASHLYYLEDAHRLVDQDVDIIAHSIRDKDIDDALIQKMKQKGVAYIPTLSLDEFQFAYANKPEWLDEPFFKVALELGVYEMITADDYRSKIMSNPNFEKNKAAYATALRNVKKLFDAGILIALGTDSGANPVRVQGFSEHLEMQLLTEAGLTPLQAIMIATQNAAKVVHKNIPGTLEKGNPASFIVLQNNPAKDIKNTRSILEVWKNGVKVNDGPLKD